MHETVESPPMPDEWDDFVLAQRGDLVQTQAWARGRAATALQISNPVARDETGALVGGAMILIRRWARNVAVGSVPYGPVLRHPHSESDVAMVLETLLQVARAAGVSLLVVQPPENATDVEMMLTDQGFRFGCPSVAPDATVRLDLTRTDEELLASMSSRRRRHLKHRAPADLDIRPDDDVEMFHRLHLATAVRQGFTPTSLLNLRTQWRELAPRGRCKILVARFRGEPIAGAFLTSFGDTVTYKLPGWDHQAARRLSAPASTSEVLQWEAMRWARRSGATRYDLGGFDRAIASRLQAGDGLPDDFSSSRHFFKYQFGGERIILPAPQWLLTDRFARAIGSRAVARLFSSPRVTALAARVRHGAPR